MCLLDCKFAQASHLMGNRFNGVLPITISSASSLEIASKRMSCEDLAIFFAYRISANSFLPSIYEEKIAKMWKPKKKN